MPAPADEPRGDSCSEAASKPLAPVLKLQRRSATPGLGRTASLPPAQLVPAIARREPLTFALFVWPGLSPDHFATAHSVLTRTVAALHDRLGIRLVAVPPLRGRLVHRSPASYGLIACDASGAYTHPGADVTLVFRSLRNLPGESANECGGIAPADSPAARRPRRFAAVDVSRVLAGTASGPDERLYYTLLHALLKALARLPTRHSEGWGWPFLIPTPGCDLEYRYPGAYGPTAEERTRGAAEGWKNYLEAILNGTAVRYVPLFDDPVAASRAAVRAKPGNSPPPAPDTAETAPQCSRKKSTAR